MLTTILAMADVLDLDHVRRGRRLFGIFLSRFGLPHFLESSSERVPRLNADKLEETLSMAVDWVSRRTGRSPTEATVALMRRDLKRQVVRHLAERMVQAGL